MRQSGDTTFADLLNALRVGELRPKHFSVLMSKVLKEATGDFEVDKALRIYPTRAQVDSHNGIVLEKYRSKGITISKIIAQDNLVNATRKDTVDINTIVSSDTNKTGGLPKHLEIFVGARVMLRSNVNIEQGLVNGAMGIVSEITWPCYRRAQVYKEDIPSSVTINFGKDGIHSIKPISLQFPALRNYGTIERRQLPLILCWACTVHKMQGCTVDNAVVFLGSKLFAKGQAYVALSCVRSLNGLRIEELDLSKLTGLTPCNEAALDEMKRMRSI
ncbi:atp-dependent dna helicase pif1-like protein [Lasius niger]|uniref:Atp-dependent dna helicase pif1-like protein n=1 Tax=Lasius niger TaxID=67767 RepID=A0A0J7JZX7_LASNI|nr:atp-dependent dna helicase pif1-like protein [Lasius niger]